MGRRRDLRIAPGARITGDFEVEPGRKVFGELSVDGKNSNLFLRDAEFFHTTTLKHRYLRGTAHDLSCLSLFGCITMSGPNSGARGNESYTFAEVFPHHIAHGPAHIGSDEKAVTSLIFSIDDGHALFYDFDALGSVLYPQRIVSSVASANTSVTKRKPPLGPYPRIHYFTGRSDLMSVDTAIGRVHVSNLVDEAIGSPTRLELQSRIGFEVEFEEPVELSKAQAEAAILTRFLEILIGRPQNRESLTLVIGSEEKTPIVLQVYSTMKHEWVRGNDKRRPGPHDVLIEGVANPRDMAKVMKKWLALDSDRRDARLRFSHCFNMERLFTEDRLVAAANMFDLLPAPAVPKRAKIRKKVIVARDKARTLFEALEDSPERHSVLSALGRLGTSRLPRRIAHRARIVTKRLPWLEPDMDLVIRQAVLCRNHYVHGSPGGFDYRAGSGAIPFFTRALEFIFGASELIECGWDIGRFGSSGGGEHPFSTLLRSWRFEVADIRARIGADECSPSRA